MDPELRNVHETFNNFALEIDERAMPIIEGMLIQNKKVKYSRLNNCKGSLSFLLRDLGTAFTIGVQVQTKPIKR